MRSGATTSLWRLLLIFTKRRSPFGRAIRSRGNGLARRTISALRLRGSGERESGTARLEEAVAAYRAALLERTRERVPLDWAMTQNNLGNALRSARRAGSGDGQSEGLHDAEDGSGIIMRRRWRNFRRRARAIMWGWRKATLPGSMASSRAFAGDEAVFVAPETPKALSGAVSTACVVFLTIPDSRTRLPG